MQRVLSKVASLFVVSAALMFLVACGSDPTATPVPTPTSPPPTPTAAPEAQPTATAMPAPTPTPTVDPFEAEWAALVAAAQAEGELEAFMSGAVGRGLPARIEVFEDQYGIPVTISAGSSRNQVEKVRAERDAGRFTLDIWIGGAGTANRSLLPGGMIDPLKPVLIHPEVLDQSAWYTGDLAWTDLETQQSILSFGADGSTARIAYNTDLVNPDDIESFWDLLEPEWHGQIVAATDPRGTGTGTNTVFFYDNPDLGPEFLTRLLTETDITLAADPVQAVNWLATGRFALCLFGCDDEAQEASEQGLPVQPQWPTVLREGAMANVGGANIMLMNRAPHPNAAKLFINWWLSREGQSIMQEVSGIDSLRIDISKDTVDSSNLRVEGYNYTILDIQPEYQDLLGQAMALAEEALGSVGK